MKQNNVAAHIVRHEGISLISLIITIIVIIILAAIVIFSGLNTPHSANLAKFVQNISDYNLAIREDYAKKKTQYATEGISRTDAQIYYIIATGNENIVDVNDLPTPVATLKELDLNTYPESLNGTEYYEITADSNIQGINKQKQFYEAEEKHYVTDKGEVFTLPGYLVPGNGTNRWYVNEKKYYESIKPKRGPESIIIKNQKLIKEDKTEVGESEEIALNTRLTISFEAIYEGETVHLKDAVDKLGETIIVDKIETNEKSSYCCDIFKNGTYTFYLEVGEGEDVKKKEFVFECNNYVFTLGSKVTFGTESFYVIQVMDDYVRMLAEKNVETRTNNVNYNKQSDNADNVKFKSNFPSSAYYLNSTIKNLVNTYVGSLNIDGATGSLLTKDDLELICGEPIQTSIETENTPEWLYGGYWLSTPSDVQYYKVWSVRNETLYSTSVEHYNGVRPVIKVPKASM